MIDLVVFDIDGVLVDTDSLHLDATNEALRMFYDSSVSISVDEYASTKCMRTRDRLMHFASKGIRRDDVQFIEKVKREIVSCAIAKGAIVRDDRLVEVFSSLSRVAHVAVATNSCVSYAADVLSRLCVGEFVELLTTGTHVSMPKPHPGVYEVTMRHFSVRPERTMVFEDSEDGVRSAVAAGAHVTVVRSPGDIDVDYVMGALEV